MMAFQTKRFLRNKITWLEYRVKDLEERLTFYSEMIDDRMEDGMSEAEAVAAIGEVEEKVIIPENEETQIMELLGAIAEIEYDSEPTRIDVDAVMIERHKLGQIYVLSKNLKRSILSEDAKAAEELSAISILSESPALNEGERSILTETDFKAI